MAMVSAPSRLSSAIKTRRGNPWAGMSAECPVSADIFSTINEFGNRDAKFAASTQTRAVYLDTSSVQFHQSFGERQAYSQSSLSAPEVRLDLSKHVKDLGDHFRGQANTVSRTKKTNEFASQRVPKVNDSAAAWCISPHWSTGCSTPASGAADRLRAGWVRTDIRPATYGVLRQSPAVRPPRHLP